MKAGLSAVRLAHSVHDWDRGRIARSVFFVFWHLTERPLKPLKPQALSLYRTHFLSFPPTPFSRLPHVLTSFPGATRCSARLSFLPLNQVAFVAPRIFFVFWHLSLYLPTNQPRGCAHTFFPHEPLGVPGGSGVYLGTIDGQRCPSRSQRGKAPRPLLVDERVLGEPPNITLGWSVIKLAPRTCYIRESKC